MNYDNLFIIFNFPSICVCICVVDLQYKLVRIFALVSETTKKGIQEEVFEFSNIVIYYFDFGWEPLLYTTLLKEVLSFITKFHSKTDYSLSSTIRIIKFKTKLHEMGWQLFASWVFSIVAKHLFYIIYQINYRKHLIFSYFIKNIKCFFFTLVI